MLRKDARGAWKICFFVSGNMLGTIPVKQREKRRSSGYADASFHSMSSNLATVQCIYILAWSNLGCSNPVIRWC
uniref:Uncharacterized protein n=1 Tax=Setaria italica TaxID=4555 RepID=K3Y0K7_SETIT